MATQVPNSYQPGDVVQRLRAGFSATADMGVEAGALGSICRVVTPGLTYKVRYADFPICVTVFHDSIAPAPQGSAGPVCEADC